MDISISQPEDDQILVNGKLVYKDSNAKWVASEELTTSEATAVREHIAKNNASINT